MTEKKVKFLYLSEEDTIRAGALNMRRCVEVIDETFKLTGGGDYLMGGPGGNEHGAMLWFPEEQRSPNMPVAGPDRRFMAMLAYLGGHFDVCGAKWYGSNVENPKSGLPRSILLVALNDPVTAKPLALMSGNLISSMRTGAVPGVAAKYLSRRGAETVGLVGCGVINRACLVALAATVEDAKEIKVFDVDKEKAGAFAADMSEELKISVCPVGSLEEAVVDADVVSVATAGARRPAIETRWLKEGCLLALSGTAELAEDCYTEDRLVFVAGGMPTEDVAWAYAIYEEAIRIGVGQELTLWEEPHWS